MQHKQLPRRLCTFARCLVLETISVFFNILWTKTKSIFPLFFHFINDASFLMLQGLKMTKNAPWHYFSHTRKYTVCVLTFRRADTHRQNALACYPSKHAQRASGKKVFSKLTSKRRHSRHCLNLTSGGKWNFFEIMDCACMCVCARVTCVFACIHEMVYLQWLRECIDRLRDCLDNQQQCLSFRGCPPTVYPLPCETFSLLSASP